MAPIGFYRHLKVYMTQGGHAVDPPPHRGALDTAHSCEEQQSTRGNWDFVWL